MNDVGLLKLNIIKTIIIVGFALSVFYHYVAANYMGLNYYPFTSFLFPEKVHFGDFLYVFNNLFDPYNYQGFGVWYFPFTFIILIPFKVFNAKIALVLYLMFFCSFLVFYVYKKIAFLSSSLSGKLLSVFVFSFMTYPFLFVFTLANVEILTFIFLALFAHFYQKKNEIGSIWSLSFSAATKIYPLAFLALFLADKKIKNIIYVVVLFLILSIVSAIPLKGGIVNSFSNLLVNYKHMEKINNTLRVGINHSVSFFALGKLSIYGIFKMFPSVFPIFDKFDPNSTMGFYPGHKFVLGDSAQRLLVFFNGIYPFLMLFLFLCAVVYIYKREDVIWEKFFLLVSLMLLIPPISYDYKLIHLFIPMLLFINCKERDKNDLLYAVLFGLLMIPKDYVILGGDISISSILNPFLLLYMSVLIMVSGIKNRRKVSS